MRIALPWLETMVELPGDEELTARLTAAGLECEVEAPTTVPTGVVTGRIVACEKHPNADRLTVCTVDVGDGEPRSIVCGAPNAEAGRVAACALPGADFGGGFVIAKRKLRGVASEGMLCSARELGQSEDHSGLIYFDDDTPVGKPVGELMARPRTLVTEALSNRGDWMSVRGVAREVAAVLGQSWNPESPGEADADTGGWKIKIEDPADCARYCGRIVEGVEIGPSPDWIAERLTASGIRPISNLVDVTNYVLLEYGHPLHAFDLDKLKGRTIGTRRAKAGERLVTLDGKERQLTPDVLAITDGSGVIAIGGIIGGDPTAVTDGTTRIFLEGAAFAPARIRAGTRALRMNTDASGRFERLVDPEGVPAALDRAVELLITLSPTARLVGAVDAYPAPPERARIELRRRTLRRILGTNLADEEVCGIFERLALSVEETTEDRWVVRVPTFRSDLVAEEDLVEEVARIHGYDRLPVRTEFRAGVGPRPEDPRVSAHASARRLLLGLGLTEVVTPTLIHGDVERTLSAGDAFFRDAVPLRNPLSSDRNALRGSLLPSLAQVLATNRARASADLAIFEVGRCFGGSPEVGVDERLRAAILLSGRGLDAAVTMGGKLCDFFDMKGLLEVYVEEFWGAPLTQEEIDPGADSGPGASGLLQPGRAVSVHVLGERVGFLGEAGESLRQRFDLPSDLPVVLAELDLDGKSLHREDVTFEPMPRFPVSNRDLAFVVPKSVRHVELASAIRQSAGELLTECRLFDVYEGKPLGEGEKSLAFMLVFRSPERSLTNDEVDLAVAGIVKHVEDSVGARIR